MPGFILLSLRSRSAKLYCATFTRKDFCVEMHDRKNETDEPREKCGFLKIFKKNSIEKPK